MANQFEQHESRALREAIERLRERVDSLEKTVFESPQEGVGPPEAAAPQPTTASTSPSEETWAADVTAPAPPKISYSPPPSELESSKPWAQQFGTAPKDFQIFGNESWETVVGERWLTWLGSGSLILAVAYFVYLLNR